ncbi:MAG TPA: phytanoyl-CoA dioxygenase family protein [Methylomirabilota bacterium]|nr:phytanoyl-CoA dioxygenase family protein [Methylomirabilota bacterium]
MLRRILDIVGMPIYAAQILSGRKAFEGNPLISSVSLNRRGLHAWRVRAAAAMAERRRRKLRHLISEDDRLAFERDGFVKCSGVLDPETFRSLVAEVRALREPAREMVEGRAVTRRIEVTPDVLARAPSLRRFLETPQWRGLTRYIGAFDVEPIVCIQTIFGAASETGPDQDPQTRLHTDTFHPTMKAWFFLEDVPLETGPFTYIPGSHRLTKRRLAWQKRMSIRASQAQKGGSFRIEDDALGPLRLRERQAFAVPANTLVVGDTFGFHARGRALRPSTRVEIYASMRPNPFNPFVSLDTAYLPFVGGRKMTIGWTFEDILVRLGLGRRIWRPIGAVDPWSASTSLPAQPRRAKAGGARPAAAP